MWHVHVPKLEALDIVEVDTDSAAVRRGPDFEHVKPLLAMLREGQSELPGDLV